MTLARHSYASEERQLEFTEGILAAGIRIMSNNLHSIYN
jgi:hypothetical protein